MERPIAAPHQRPSTNIDASDTGWEIHIKVGEGGRSWEKKKALLFTLPYLLFILLQNFTQTVAHLHTGVGVGGSTGSKRQKIKIISHPKGINNIKDKLLFL